MNSKHEEHETEEVIVSHFTFYKTRLEGNQKILIAHRLLAGGRNLNGRR